MSRSTNRKDATATAIRAVSLAVLAGLAAGLPAALLDTRQAASELEGASALGLLLLQTTGRLTVAGGLLGLVSALLAIAGGAAAERLGKKRLTGASLALAIAVSPALVYVSIRLFQGGVTSQLPARSALIGATAIFLAAGALAAARIALALVSRAEERRGRLLVLIAAAVLLLAGAGARWCDAHMYRRLYQYLHVVLAVLTLFGFALAARLLLSAVSSPTGAARFAAVGMALAALLAALAGMTVQSRQAVKVAMYDRTATTANLLIVVSGPREIGKGPRPSQEIRKKRYERERMARAAALDGDYPAFPGAHLVMITIDALRADRLGVYGYHERDLTPHIDEWARGATVFDRAYCTAPHSSFSISSLHTSRYLHDESMLGKEISHPTIAEILGAEGYETTALYTQGIFFTEGDRVAHYRSNEFGFQTSSHGAPPPDKLTDNAMAEIDRMVAKGEPAFFMWVHYFNVHEPYRSTRFGTSPRDRYEGEVSVADEQVDRLITYIETKLARDTVIVLSADHGEEFKEHGGHYHGSSLFDEQVRVPFIVKAPEGRAGRVATPISLVDAAPTMLALVGVTPPTWMAGMDLRPAIFEEEATLVERPVFASVMHRHMALQWPWKLVSDPSRGLFELYHLEKDPGETVNRYDGNKVLAQNLLQETYAWLDELGKGADQAQTALNLGRMRDKRAVGGLLEVAVNTGAPTSDRLEALDLLADIKAWGHEAELERLLDDPDVSVATRAALALAALDNDAGRSVLQDALYDDDPDTRDGAALALGRLDDPSAVPALIEALGRVDLKVRENAIRLLGNLKDPRATEPLIETIAEDRTRYLTVLALGKIGDPRAYDTLMDVLKYETHTDIRGYAVVALGWMEAREAVPRLLRVLTEEPELRWTPEALIRLGAVGTPPLFGTDIAKDSKAKGRGWGKCTRKDRIISGEFLGRTTCATSGPRATLDVESDIAGEALLIARGRHLLADREDTVDLAVFVDGEEIAAIPLTGEFKEHRLDTPAGIWKKGRHRVTLELKGKGRFELDHLLVVDKNCP